ncbi:MAG: DUF3316 domain-containing protein [Bacteroidaceae bacterium]|nr:DUF3316 domain-containing protein [Bacteroidaceae bacterium]
MRNTNLSLSRLLACTLLLALSVGAAAQTLPLERRSSTFGLGYASDYDSYLSPVSYGGMALVFDYETWIRSELFADDVFEQTYVAGSMADLKNEAGNGAAMDGYVDVSYALPYRFLHRNRLDLFAGPVLMAELGGVYNMRNSNNPAQVKLDADLGVTLQAAWRFHLLRNDWRLSWQADVPLVGFFFSPSYQQSYYEIFYLGHTDHTMHMSTPLNSLSMRQFVRLDLERPNGYVRLQGSYGINQWHAEGNRYRHDAFVLSVGYVHFLQFLSPKQVNL